MAENSLNRDYYADLGLNPYATAEEIKSAFHKLAKLHHPDRKGPEHDGDTSEFRKAREAYEKLSDQDAKAAYDRSRGRSTTHRNVRQYKPPGADNGGEEERPKRSFTYSMEEFRRRCNPPGGFQRTGAGKFASSHYRSQSTPQPPPLPKAHGVRVKMTDHPASKTTYCPYKAERWTKQSGTEYCIFCLSPSNNVKRCPACEASACPACLSVVNQVSEDHINRPKSWYWPSGG